MSAGRQSLTRQVGLSLVWVGFATVASRGLSLLRKLVLARLLVPGDFGLVAYAALTIGVLQLFQEMGFSSALIYGKYDNNDAADTTFAAVLMSSVLLYALAWLSAPPVAQFFRNEALVSVLRTLSLTLVISSVSQVPLTLMAKGMGFKTKVIPEIIGGVMGSGASVVLALMGYGVWSIVYGQLITCTVISIAVWFFCPWRPRWKVNLKVARELWDYGRHIIASQIMVFFITNIDDAFIGRLLWDAALGTYTLAYDLSNLPATHLSRIVGQVTFPAFSQVQSDARRLRSAFFKSMRFVALAAFPIAIITLVFAEDFIVVAYGKKWFGSIVPLQLLTIYGLARAIAVTMGNVFKAGGRPKWLFYIACWRLTIMAALLYPAIKLWGIVGVAGLSAGVAVVDFALSLFLTNRIIRAPWRIYASILLPMLVAAVGTALIGHQLYLWTEDMIHPFISLPLTGGLALTMYFLLMYLYDAELRYMSGKAVKMLLQELRERMARRQAASSSAGSV